MKSLTTTYPRLRHTNSSGAHFIHDKVLIRFFIHRTHHEIAGAIKHALDAVREGIRPHQLDSYVGHDGYMRALTEPLWEEVREKMLDADESFVLRLTGGVTDSREFWLNYSGLRIPSPWPFRARDTSSLHVSLPTEYLEERGSAHLRSLALEMARELPFNSGYVTLACTRDGWGEYVELVRTRYRGMHLTDESPAMDIMTRVDGVHWLNFLGQPVLGQLGGMEGLRKHLTHPDISLHDMGAERVLIALGEEPRVEDVPEGETLHLQPILARLLAPHFYHCVHPFGRMNPQEQLQWERRFLPDAGA